MRKLHIFIDGSWLFKICGPEKVLANQMEESVKGISINFEKLNNLCLNHVKKYKQDCNELGDRYYSTSLFEFPSNFDQWPDFLEDITTQDIIKTRRNVHRRSQVANNALRDGGYSDEAIYRPIIKGYMIEQLKNNTYQEKQVDSSVVALLVRSAITKPDDYHMVFTGDSDIIPAIKVAYPKYSKNVVIATSHPDELEASCKQSSFSLQNFNFEIPPLYLQEYVKHFVHGDNIYECGNCHTILSRKSPINSNSRPYCRECIKLKK